MERLATALAAVVVLASCVRSSVAQAQDPRGNGLPDAPFRIQPAGTSPNAVPGPPISTRGLWVMSNNPENSVAAFVANPNGTLTWIQTIPTGGQGSNAITDQILVNSHALATAWGVGAFKNRNLVLAVNPGSNTVTSFNVRPDHTLEVYETLRLQGTMPCAVSYAKNTACAITCAGAGTLECWTLDNNGKATGSWPARSLGAGQAANSYSAYQSPADVAVTPGAEAAVVVVKNMGVWIFPIDPTTGPSASPFLASESADRAPLGVAVGQDVLGTQNIMWVTEGISPPCTTPTNNLPPPQALRGECNGSIAAYALTLNGPVFQSRTTTNGPAPRSVFYLADHLFAANTGPGRGESIVTFNTDQTGINPFPIHQVSTGEPSLGGAPLGSVPTDLAVVSTDQCFDGAATGPVGPFLYTIANGMNAIQSYRIDFINATSLALVATTELPEGFAALNSSGLVGTPVISTYRGYNDTQWPGACERLSSDRIERIPFLPPGYPAKQGWVGTFTGRRYMPNYLGGGFANVSFVGVGTQIEVGFVPPQGISSTDIAFLPTGSLFNFTLLRFACIGPRQTSTVVEVHPLLPPPGGQLGQSFWICSVIKITGKYTLESTLTQATTMEQLECPQRYESVETIASASYPVAGLDIWHANGEAVLTVC